MLVKLNPRCNVLYTFLHLNTPGNTPSFRPLPFFCYCRRVVHLWSLKSTFPAGREGNSSTSSSLRASVDAAARNSVAGCDWKVCTALSFGRRYRSIMSHRATRGLFRKACEWRGGRSGRLAGAGRTWPTQSLPITELPCRGSGSVRAGARRQSRYWPSHRATTTTPRDGMLAP